MRQFDAVIKTPTETFRITYGVESQFADPTECIRSANAAENDVGVRIAKFTAKTIVVEFKALTGSHSEPFEKRVVNVSLFVKTDKAGPYTFILPVAIGDGTEWVMDGCPDPHLLGILGFDETVTTCEQAKKLEPILLAKLSAVSNCPEGPVSIEGVTYNRKNYVETLCLLLKCIRELCENSEDGVFFAATGPLKTVNPCC